MNQILNTQPTGGNNNNNINKQARMKEPKMPRNVGSASNTKNILVFFGISMIIFGICVIATSSYGLYKSKVESKGDVATVLQKPELTINDNGDNTLTISATHKDGIESITYSWNGEETTEPGNGQTTIEKVIEMPTGTNTLTVTATATNGEAMYYEKMYTVKSDIQIELEAIDKTIQATITGENEISYVTYKWDDDEENRQDINSTEGKITIDIPDGQHTLTVIAVDVNNNTEVKTQEIKGVKKPSIKVTQDGENFVVKVADETGLDRVEFILNGKGYLVRLEGAVEKEFKYPLEDGENTIEATVYNMSGEEESTGALCRK